MTACATSNPKYGEHEHAPNPNETPPAATTPTTPSTTPATPPTGSSGSQYGTPDNYGVDVLSGDAASIGIFPYLYMIAVLSVSIGLINLFPIPMLDGGHLVFYVIEAIRRKPLGQQAQE